MHELEGRLVLDVINCYISHLYFFFFLPRSSLEIGSFFFYLYCLCDMFSNMPHFFHYTFDSPATYLSPFDL